MLNQKRKDKQFKQVLLTQRQLQTDEARQDLTRQGSMRCGVFIFQLAFLHYTITSCITDNPLGMVVYISLLLHSVRMCRWQTDRLTD